MTTSARGGNAIRTFGILCVLAYLLITLGACNVGSQQVPPPLVNPDNRLLSTMLAEGETSNYESLANSNLLPLDGSTVSGLLYIRVADPENILEVRFYLDGVFVASDYRAPFSILIDSRSMPDGNYTVVAVVPLGRPGESLDVAEASFVVANRPIPEPPTDPEPQPRPQAVIHPSNDPHRVIAAHPPGTTFKFSEGTHRLDAAIVPRNDDTFVGENGAVLSGAKRLSTFSREANLWVAEAQEQRGQVHGACMRQDSRCGHPNNLYINDVPLIHVSSKDRVVPGTFFFDYDTSKIYFATNPEGRKVETSVAFSAFNSGADNVTIRNLTVEKFANPAQFGAIHALSDGNGQSGTNWRIENNTIRLNHGVGIKAGHGARITGNYLYRNGQLGISGFGPGVLIEDNEIAHNNFAGFMVGWEAGGAKFVETTGLVVRNNHVHHNQATGLWTDVDNIDTLYEHNLVERNRDAGIWHELSYRATIRHNTVRDNGVDRASARAGYNYVFKAGILVHNSADVSVYGNTVTGNWNGITGLHQNRGAGRYGPWELRNLHVYDNVIEMLYHPRGQGPQGEIGVPGVSGVAQDVGMDAIFSKSYNNRFENNTYVVPSGNQPHFTWRDRGMNFSSWRLCGGASLLWPDCRQDANGRVVTNLDAAVLRSTTGFAAPSGRQP